MNNENNPLILSAAFVALSLIPLILRSLKTKEKEDKFAPDRIVGKRLEKRVSLKDFPKTKNVNLLLAAKGKKPKSIPIWIMRQAGRYLPEFRELRKQYDFFTMCQNPQVATTVTLQPLKRFPDLDAVIVFSDILVIPQAMGMEVLMVPGRGPVFPNPLATPSDISKLDLKLTEKMLEDRLGYVFDVVNLTRQQVKGQVPVIGFSGAPFTLLGYMIEGGGSKTYEKVKKWILNHNKETHLLLDALSTIIIDYCVKKVEAGAQLIQIFESSAGELPVEQYFEICFKYLQKIGKGLRQRLGPDFPLTVFARRANQDSVLERLENETDFDVIGIDWTMTAQSARKRVVKKAVQGNLDPCALFASKHKIREYTIRMLDDFDVKNNSAYIANLGHGMMPAHDPEHLGTFIKAVKEYSS